MHHWTSSTTHLTVRQLSLIVYWLKDLQLHHQTHEFKCAPQLFTLLIMGLRKKRSRIIRVSEAQRGLKPALSVNRSRLYTVDFLNEALLLGHWGAAQAPSLLSRKATRGHPVAHLLAAGAGPWALWAPAWVPGGALWRDILTQHHHSGVRLAERSWPATSEA